MPCGWGAWLHRLRLKKKIDAVNREIEVATKAKDDGLLLELSKKKIELNRDLNACLAEGEE